MNSSPPSIPNPQRLSPGEPASFNTGLGRALPGAAAYALLCPAVVWFLVLIVNRVDTRPSVFHLVYLLAPVLLFGKVVTDALARRVKLEGMCVVTSVGATLAALALGVSSGSLCAVLTNLDRTQVPREVPVVGSLALASVLLLFGVAPLAMSRATLLRASRLLFGLAMLFSAVFGVVFAMAARRAASLPGVDHYETDLRRIHFDEPGVLQNPSTVGRREAGLYPTSRGYVEPPRYLPGPFGETRSPNGGLAIVQSCTEEGCRLRIFGADAGPTGQETAAGGVFLGWDQCIDLLVDERGGVVYVRRESGAVDRLLEKAEGAWVMRVHDARQVARRASVPVAWLLTSGALLLLTAIQWSRRRGVVVRANRVISGELAAHRESAALRVMCLDAGIIAAACLGTAPLIGAAIAGLVL